MEVLHLIDQLEAMLSEGRPVRPHGHVRVDQAVAYSLIDQVRTALPEDIRHARWIVEDRRERAESDQEGQELSRIASTLEALRRSQPKAPPPLTAAAAEQLQAILGAAEESARRIVDDAEREARDTRAEAARILADARRSASGQMADEVARMRQAAGQLADRSVAAAERLDAILDQVRGPAASLADALAEGASGVREELVAFGAMVADVRSEQEEPAGDPHGGTEELDAVLPGRDDIVVAVRLEGDDLDAEEAPQGPEEDLDEEPELDDDDLDEDELDDDVAEGDLTDAGQAGRG